MVSGMESNRGDAGRESARNDLEAVEQVQRAVRDTPWPAWLYPVNALLLGLIALALLLDGWARLAVVVVLGITTAAVNAAVGRRIGAPWVVPTSRAFQIGLGVSVCGLVAAFLVADLGGSWGRPWMVVVLAVVVTAGYLLGAVPRMRSARR